MRSIACGALMQRALRVAGAMALAWLIALSVGVGGAYADEARPDDGIAGEEGKVIVERDSQTGRLANSWRYEEGLLGGGASLFSRSAGVTWKHSDGVYSFSNGVKDSKANAAGIDVSYHNGSIDWAKVKKAGVDYAIIRCGYGGDDPDQDDTRFLANVKACQKYDIPFGVYLYSYADTTTRAKSELAHVKRLLNKAGLSPDDVAYPVYYDLEEQKADGTPYVSNATLLKIATAFCDGIEDAGYTAGVYANLNWWNNYLTSSKYDQWERWVAQYNTSCQYKGYYGMWQLTSNGSVAGISGDVDLNLSYASYGVGLVRDAKGVRYKQADGSCLVSAWKEVGVRRYYFGASGYALTGEQAIDGKKYCFNEDGSQVMGWHTWSDGSRSYYVASRGGAAAKGWWTLDGKRYYFDKTTCHTHWGKWTIDGKVYYLAKAGHATTGWRTWSDGTRSYFSSQLKGAAGAGWWTIGGKRYHFDAATRKTHSGALEIGGKLYCFAKDGSVTTGWHTWSDGTRSYFSVDKKGSAAKGWWTIGGKRYYFDHETCRSYTGAHRVNGVMYVFDSSGALRR